MGSPLRDEEKRFLLAEMIKVGTIEISSLVDFVKRHQVEPLWLSMQLPNGRNMQQCLAAAEDMFQRSMPAPNLKRKSITDAADHPTKKLSMTPTSDHAGVLPSPAIPDMAHPAIRGPNPHIHIQPRPAVSNGYVPPVPGQPVNDPPRPKRRGRPPKSQQKDHLRARLPPHLTPLAPHPSPPVAILSISTPQDLGSPSTPTPAYSAAPLATSAQVREEQLKTRRREATGDGAEPRVVVEGALEQFQKTVPIATSEPTPTEHHWPLDVSEEQRFPPTESASPQPSVATPSSPINGSPSLLQKDQPAPLKT